MFHVKMSGGVRMSHEQAERARQQLYEDVGTRDELSDDEAEVLLRWGETQIRKLADANMDDAQFDAAFAHLTRLMTRMNRFAARRAEQAPDEQNESLNRIVESAAGVGLTVDAPDAFAAQGVDDVMSALRALLKLFTPNSADSPQALAPVQPQAIVPMESQPDSRTRETADDEEEQPQ
jgi:hypothetical protein